MFATPAQHDYPDLPRLPPKVLEERRVGVFLVLSGLFLGTLAMLNILGISRFLDLSFELPGLGKIPMPLAVGVLPYPVTFLCTDFLCELYGRRRANAVVLMGLALNVWVMFILWLGGSLPGVAGDGSQDSVFFAMQRLAFGAVTASMLAYLTAQFIDVQLFHMWKRWTQGRHLWLRNNGSTLVSQLVDTVAVILATHYLAGALPLQDGAVAPQLWAYIRAGYAFKLVASLVDTVPFYLGVRWLSRYLRLPLAYRSQTASADVAAGASPS